MQDAKGKAQQEALAFIADKKMFPLLARLLGTSDFLWEDFLRRQYSNLLPLLQGYRDAPLMIIGEGPNEVLRNLIAKSLVKKYPA